MQVLVEIEFNEIREGGLGSLQHDQSKYEFYYEQVVSELSGTIVSPLDPNHSISVTVHQTEVAKAAPAVWHSDGHGSIPANVPFVGGPNANGSRLGAFEVYLCTDFPDLDISVPACSGLHSKLRSRHWPNARRLQKMCRAIVMPVFERWKHDEDLRARMPTIYEATGEMGPFVIAVVSASPTPLTQRPARACAAPVQMHGSLRKSSSTLHVHNWFSRPSSTWTPWT